MNSYFKKLFNDKFIIYTIIISFVLGLLYVWKGVLTEFNVWGWIVIVSNFLYIPFALAFRQRGFPFFYFLYSAILIFATAFDKTFLYNNYTALFMMSIGVMIQPKLRWIAMILYFSFVCIAFGLNEEKIYHFFIHVVRSLWFIGIVEYVLNDKFRRKKLVLYEDERNILDQLAGGMVYQKEVSGFSENTVYRKLKAARERNGNITREELVERYKKEKENSEL